MIAPPEAPLEVAIAARVEIREPVELSPELRARAEAAGRALVHRAARAGLYRTQQPEAQVDGQLSHLWRARHDGGPVVGRRYERWWWAPPGSTWDEIRHSPTCDTEPEALAALLDWLDRPADRRPDWLAGRRPDYLRPRSWRS